MRILAILIMTVTAVMAVEGSLNDLPESIAEDTNKMIVSQMKILEDAQEDLVRLRERFIRSLERDLRKYERRGDDAASVKAIEALIAAQKEALDLMIVGRQVVDSGLPVDPEQPQDIFDTRTVEERKADLAAQREWEDANVSGAFSFKLSYGVVPKTVIHPDEHNLLNREGEFKMHDASLFKPHGPVIDHDEVFKSIFPKSYEIGVRPTGIATFALQLNGVSITDTNQVVWNKPFNIIDLAK